ncbi:MAG TPA: 5-formyltetrahydrofolate cyclo-ligase [Humisphaera sp.]
MTDVPNKPALRRRFRDLLAAMTDADRHAKSQSACALLATTPEFAAASVVMMYLSTPSEVDTAALALKCWQAGKAVVVPRVSWDQRRMLPVEITSLQAGLTAGAHGIREPDAATGKPIPIDLIDLVVVPGLGFSEQGHRIGRGMGFYDRFLAQPEFVGVSCGLAFSDQVVADMPVLDHDVPLSMLVTDRGVRRFSPNLITSK